MLYRARITVYDAVLHDLGCFQAIQQLFLTLLEPLDALLLFHDTVTIDEYFTILADLLEERLHDLVALPAVRMSRCTVSDALHFLLICKVHLRTIFLS